MNFPCIATIYRKLMSVESCMHSVMVISQGITHHESLEVSIANVAIHCIT